MNDCVTPTPPAIARPRIQVWIDFVCPYCLLGEVIIRQAIQGLDVDIEWMPFELRPYPAPTLRPEDDYLPAAWKNGVYPAARRLGVDLQLPSVSPQPYTRKAFLGLQFAARHGKGDAYVDAVLRAFFQQDRDIGDTAVLHAIARDLGLPADGLDTALASADYGAAHDTSLQAAQAAGIRAVPSLGIGGRVFSGMPNAAALRGMLVALA